jgi:hypothetical protein
LEAGAFSVAAFLAGLAALDAFGALAAVVAGLVDLTALAGWAAGTAGVTTGLGLAVVMAEG